MCKFANTEYEKKSNVKLLDVTIGESLGFYEDVSKL